MTTIASYLALIAFIGLLGGLATLRWDFKRMLWRDAISDAENSVEDRTAIRPGRRFWPGFWIGGAIGAIFIVGYHVQHGRDHLDQQES